MDSPTTVKIVSWKVVIMKAAIPKIKNIKAYRLVLVSSSSLSSWDTVGFAMVIKAVSILAKNKLNIGKITPLASAKKMPTTNNPHLSEA